MQPHLHFSLRRGSEPKGVLSDSSTTGFLAVLFDLLLYAVNKQSCHWILLNHCCIYHWTLLNHCFISIRCIVASLLYIVASLLQVQLLPSMTDVFRATGAMMGWTEECCFIRHCFLRRNRKMLKDPVKSILPGFQHLCTMHSWTELCCQLTGCHSQEKTQHTVRPKATLLEYLMHSATVPP